MLSWFAALIWPYKGCSFYAAFIAESNGDFESIRTSKAQLVASHTSKSARRFTEWFVETGIFREWIRRKVIYCDFVIRNAKTYAIIFFRIQIILFVVQILITFYR